MTPTDSNDGNSNDRMPAQEKLAWVKPKITPMEAISVLANNKVGKTIMRVPKTTETPVSGPPNPVCHKPRLHQQKLIAPTGLQRPFLVAWSVDYLAPSVLI